MGTVVLEVLAAAYGPFWYYGLMQEVLGRMFPFGRELCRAFWAPNFWIFYVMLDKIIGSSLIKLGFNIQAPKASFTGGLMGGARLLITPLVTFITVLLELSPCLTRLGGIPNQGWSIYGFVLGASYLFYVLNAWGNIFRVINMMSRYLTEALRH